MRRRTFVQSALATAVAASVPVGQLFAASGRSTTKIAGDINAITGSGEAKVIEKAVVEELAASLRGRLLLPTSEGYDAARKVWNGMIDKRPALIARCTCTEDVQASVQLAREHELLVSVRGGGHNYAGKSVCDDGLMIDLSPMKGIRVDPVRRTSRAHAVQWCCSPAART